MSPETSLQLSILIPNLPGNLAQLTDMLRAANINISAISMYEQGEQCIVHLIVDDVETAKLTLQPKYRIKTSEIFVFRMKNQPGAIAAIGRACAGAGINIHTLYSTTSGKEAVVYVAVDDREKAAIALKAWKTGPGQQFVLP